MQPQRPASLRRKPLRRSRSRSRFARSRHRSGSSSVGVAHPLLEGAWSNALGGHPGAEGVAEVVEANGRTPAARRAFLNRRTVPSDRAPSPCWDARRPNRHRLGRQTLEVTVQLAGDLVSEGSGAGAAPGLGRHPVPADVVAAHPYRAGLPVHVAPTQGKQLALAQAGHRCGQEDRAIGAPEWLRCGVDCSQQGAELLLVEKSDIGVRLDHRRVDQLSTGSPGTIASSSRRRISGAGA